MALTKVPHRPGIVKDDPALTSEGVWVDGDNVRFHQGRPEKIGGFTRLIADKVIGKARGLLSWVSNNGNPAIAIGTHVKLYVLFNEVLVDVTPIRESGTLTNPFAVTAGSGVVTVTDENHGTTVGSYVHFSGASAVGGVTPFGMYRVVAVLDESTYQIEHAEAATATVTAGGGTVAYQYELAVGMEYGALNYGWGVGPWGGGFWGTPREHSTVLEPRTWALASWGENMLALPHDGSLYEYTVDTLDRVLKVTVANGYEESAPNRATSMFVTPERFVVLLGTYPFAGNYDPLLVRWADQETLDVWTPQPTNLAGEYKLAVGSRIVAGTVSRLQNLIWTDNSLYGMRYLGDAEFVFGFDLIGVNCGLAGPNAFTELDGVVYWMSPSGQFQLYDGSPPRTLPCPVRRWVFDSIVRSQYDAVWCAVNAEFGEIWWWFAGNAAAPEVDRYAAYCPKEDAWFIGTMARTAWIDRTAMSRPVAVAPDGILYLHEIGVDADGGTLAAHIEGAPFDLGDGDQVMAVHRIVPDVTMRGELDVTLRTRRWPQDVLEIDKTRVFRPASRKIDIRGQGRQAALRFAADAPGDWFRLGDVRLDMTPAGRR